MKKKKKLAKYMNIHLDLIFEIKHLFPELEISVIKKFISQYKDLETIISQVITFDLENFHFFEEKNEINISENEKKSLTSTKYGINSTPVFYDFPCKLYLPASLFDVHIDLDSFGSFDQINMNSKKNLSFNKNINQPKFFG